jgi:hypothetical protein
MAEKCEVVLVFVNEANNAKLLDNKYVVTLPNLRKKDKPCIQNMFSDNI